MKEEKELTEEELEFVHHKEGLWDTKEEELQTHIKFFEKKSKTDAKACYVLSRYYLFGQGNYEKGFEMAQKGFSLGDPNCYGLIGKCYEKGLGVEKDLEKAIKIYELLSAHDNVFGKYALADMYLFGKGVEKDKRKALEMFCDLATNNNYAKAKYKLGIMYENGYGTAKNFQRAIHWYRKAILEDDFQKAYCNLGGMYLNGKGVPMNLKKAFEYFSLGAQNNDARCFFMLAKCHYRGLGTKQNTNKAIKLLKKADKRGDKLAKDYMQDVVGHKENELEVQKSTMAFFADFGRNF